MGMPLHSDQLDQLQDSKSALAAELQDALRQTVFSSGLSISPRRLGQIAQMLGDTFLDSLATDDDVAAASLGQQLAADGLSPRSVVAVTDRLRSVGATSSSSTPGSGITVQAATSRFCAAFLVGYMEGREQAIQQEAERSVRAHLAVRDRLKGTQVD
jgi:hypothetical protein